VITYQSHLLAANRVFYDKSCRDRHLHCS